MNDLLHQFHFLRPWWLVALILLPLIAWLGLRRNVAQRQLSQLVDAALLPHLLRGRAGSQQLPLWLFVLGWVLSTLALAGPTWGRVEQPLYAKRAAQVVAISLSQHMLARDVTPSRLDRARYKAHDLLASNQDGLNALIGYAGEAFVVAPLTSDANSLSDLLDSMAPGTMPVDGNNAALAIERGVKLINDAKAGGGSLVLITDQANAAADAAARKAHAAGVRVSVLGVGTTQGGPVPLPSGGFLHDTQGHMELAQRDDAALAALAAAGGGRYVAMTPDQRDINLLHTQLRNAPAQTVTGEQGDAWQDRGPWLLLPLLLIVALAFRRGWLLLVPLVILPMLPSTAEATTWHDLWQRPDQQAAQALRDGHPKQALQLAHDPALRGAAAYRAGSYAEAARALQQAPGSDATYNLGNALAKQGQYKQAIDAYDHALKLDSGNADALANRKAVEDWLRQQQKKKQDSKKSDSQKQKQDKQGNSGDKNSSSDSQGKSDKSEAQKKSAQKDGKSSPDKSSPGKSSPDKDDKPSTQNQSAKPASGQQDGSKKSADAQQTAKQQAVQKAQAAKAQAALKQQMDKALAGQPKPVSKTPHAHQLGALGKDDPELKLPADLKQALQRVPDDPGALLRRKFELKYQQRHAGASNEDGQP